jgi:hypothetical protein
MLMGRWSLEHASYIRYLVVVLLLSMVLWRSELEMGGRGEAAPLPLNKLANASDLTTVAFDLLLLSHHVTE